MGVALIQFYYTGGCLGLYHTSILQEAKQTVLIKA